LQSGSYLDASKGGAMTFRRLIFLAGAAALLLWLRPWRRLRALIPASQPDQTQPFTGMIGGYGPASFEAAGPSQQGTDEARPAVGASQQAAQQAEVSASLVAAPEVPIDPLYGELTIEDVMAPPPEPDLTPAVDPIRPQKPGALASAALPDITELDRPEIPARAEGAAAEDGEDDAEAGQSEDIAATEEGESEPAAPPDDLLLIEGIGPRTSTVVAAAGIRSFADLAATDVERLRSLLADAGIKTLNPATWPEQARVAAEGRWDDLKALQDRIKNGKLES
jgi:predicted flap endonuclease-1-like 5' DNA nuclease